MADVVLDCADVKAGPALIDIGGDDQGHTIGGVTVNIEPQTRAVVVDAYGETPCKMVHIGDNMRITANLASWVASVIKAAYQSGRDQSAAVSNPYIGIGRAAGYVYTGVALIVRPSATADVARIVNMWKSVSIGALEINYNHEDDRVFSVEWQGMVDPTKVDGEQVGSIVIAAA